jgi:UDP-N-acetylmuramyl tripeptide synthase
VAATRLGLGVANASRRLGLGSGSVIGGRVTLAIDAGALHRLSAGHRLALVSGTNGKTTTTALLSAALRTQGQVATNSNGSNLPAGLVAELSRAPAGAPGALEVDEAWLRSVANSVNPAVVVLLNLSRDQLDRVSEVRRLGIAWREMATNLSGARLVANADDPLVAWAAMGSDQVTWIAAGSSWRMDSSGCPSCGARIDFETPEAAPEAALERAPTKRLRLATEEASHRIRFGRLMWACASCGLARPDPVAWIEDGQLVLAGGRRLSMTLCLPGGFNQANAAMAGIAAELMGVPLTTGLAAMADVSHVVGRYQVLDLPERGAKTRQVRLLLAKNPAGWGELLTLLDQLSAPPAPVVVSINSRIADGRDPSWLWDVPFERLAGRFTVATGERCSDLAVRLLYAEVDHAVEPDPLKAMVRAARSPGAGQIIDAAANYTAFQDLRRTLARVQPMTVRLSRGH